VEQAEIKTITLMDQVFPVKQRGELEVQAEELSEDLRQLGEQEILHQHHLHKVIQVEEDTSHRLQLALEAVEAQAVLEATVVIKMEVLEEHTQILT
jgi:hypothetical protein